MATFNFNGDVTDTEQFVTIVQNLNRDAENVEDRIRKLHNMGSDVSMAVDTNALDNDEDDVLKITVKIPQ